MKATEQYFPAVLFIMLYKVVLTFQSVDEILKCDHSNESYLVVLSCGAVYYANFTSEHLAKTLLLFNCFENFSRQMILITNVSLFEHCTEVKCKVFAWSGFVSIVLFSFCSTVWSYSACPDIDECKLGIAQCHHNATCVNLPDLFDCNCNRGFTGDGKLACNKT